MLKWILIGLGAVVVILVGLAGAGWYFANQPIDPNSAAGQGYAVGFRKSFVQSCKDEATRTAAGADAATQAKFETMCACAAEATYEKYKDHPPARLISLWSDAAEQQAIAEIMQQCGQQAGLQ